MPDYTSLQELLAAITSNILVLGAASAALLGLLWRFLADYLPGNAYQPTANWKRLISNAMPFVVVYAAFGAQHLFGYTHDWAGQTFFDLFTHAVSVLGTQHAVYSVYKLTAGHDQPSPISTKRHPLSGSEPATVEVPVETPETPVEAP
jgi:uncharacterized membrane protein